jgi:hypothetical protein
MPLLLAVAFALVPRYCLATEIGEREWSAEFITFWNRERFKRLAAIPKNRKAVLYQPDNSGAKMELLHSGSPYTDYPDAVASLGFVQRNSEMPALLLPDDFLIDPVQTEKFLNARTPNSALGHVTMAHLACRMHELIEDEYARGIYKHLAEQNLKKLSRDCELSKLDIPSLIEAGLVAKQLGFISYATTICKVAAKKDATLPAVKFLQAFIETDPDKKVDLITDFLRCLSDVNRRVVTEFQPAKIADLELSPYNNFWLQGPPLPNKQQVNR